MEGTSVRAGRPAGARLSARRTLELQRLARLLVEIRTRAPAGAPPSELDEASLRAVLADVRSPAEWQVVVLSLVDLAWFAVCYLGIRTRRAEVEWLDTIAADCEGVDRDE